MLTYLFAALVFLHAAIHFIGFAKTLGADNSTGAFRPVPGHQGWLWLLAALLLTITGILVLVPGQRWFFTAFVATLLSQMVIIFNWKEARWGTVVNAIILVVLLLVLLTLYVNFLTERQRTTN